MEASWVFTLWSYFQLQESDRRRHAIERAGRIEFAHLVRVAFHDPNKLGREVDRLLADIGSAPATVAQARAAGESLLQRITRARARASSRNRR